MNEQHDVLLHVCCANCATACIERLTGDGYRLSLFFTNSNIDTGEEFARRLKDARELAVEAGLPFHADSYDHNAWLKSIAGFENEPERGKRCRKCFEYSLSRTAEKASELKIPHFTTTLTVSPHKVSKMIFEIGGSLKGFLPVDFKKLDGFKRSLELGRKHNFYRQSYCGCEFSRKLETCCRQKQTTD